MYIDTSLNMITGGDGSNVTGFEKCHLPHTIINI